MTVELLRTPQSSDWAEVKRRALVTVGKEAVKAPDPQWLKKILTSRHSPIRYLQFSFLIKDIPYWLSTELSRHHEGCEKYIRSQRDDRNKTEVPRSEKPQGALVNMIFDCNAESLMTIMNKRLCGCATKEMQELMLEIRAKVIEMNTEFTEFLVPMCEYIGHCPEVFSCCGKNALYFSRVKGGKDAERR